MAVAGSIAAARWEQWAALAGQRVMAAVAQLESAVAQLESGMAMGWQVVGSVGQK
jgi:hypothetical protein